MEFRLLLRILVLPPGLNIVLGLLGLSLLFRWRRLAIALLAGNLLLLYILSTPFGIQLLTEPLENAAPALTVNAATASDAQVIVLLSGAIYVAAPEYERRDSVMPGTLARMQYAAWLKQRTQLPLLVSGGSVYGNSAPIADVMARVLRDELNTAVAWSETNSRNTEENAKYTADMLISQNIKRILLVTDASHMPRASRYFKRNGFNVVAAPTRFYSTADYSGRPWARYYPSAYSFERSVAALHEYLGLAVARFW